MIIYQRPTPHRGKQLCFVVFTGFLAERLRIEVRSLLLVLFGAPAFRSITYTTQATYLLSANCNGQVRPVSYW